MLEKQIQALVKQEEELEQKRSKLDEESKRVTFELGVAKRARKTLENMEETLKGEIKPKQQKARTVERAMDQAADVPENVVPVNGVNGELR